MKLLVIALCLLAAMEWEWVTVVKAKECAAGEIQTYEEFKYGALEAKVKGSAGNGAITGLVWLKAGSENSEWQELAYEFFGKSFGKLYQTQIITPGAPEPDDPAHEPRTQHLEQASSPVDFSSEFVKLRIEWEPSRLAFYYNDALVREETAASDYSTYSKFFDPSRVESMSVHFNLWAGFSDWSGRVDPSKPPTPAQVDYIRYEAWDPASSSFVPAWQDDFNSLDTQRWQVNDQTFEFAVNDFNPANVAAENGLLTIRFTRT